MGLSLHVNLECSFKCEGITVTKKTKVVKADCKLHDIILAGVTSAKYLGVHISNILV